MFRYSGFGLTIDSELELQELPPGDGAPDVVIRLGHVPRVQRKATIGEEYVFNTHAGGFHLRAGREILLEPLPGADPHALRIVLLGKVMAFLLRQKGWLPLHASGVAIAGEAVLFLGDSGSGKSTTAAAFHSQGHTVITDDLGAVRVRDHCCLVHPAAAPVRLPEDSRAVLEPAASDNGYQGVLQCEKHAYKIAGRSATSPLPVRRIYVLEYGAEVQSGVIPTASAVRLLSRYSFVRHRRMDRLSLEYHLRDCSAVAMTVTVCLLKRPRSLGTLGELVRLVEGELTSRA